MNINIKDDNTATEEIKRQVKSLIVSKGYTLEKLAEELKSKFNTTDSKTGISNKLARGSLRYIDMLRILDVLGYDFSINDR